MLPLRAPCRLRSSCVRTKMPWFLLCVWWTLLLAAAVDCINLPSIHWNTSNPMFKASNNDHIVEVNINDEIDFVCPYVARDPEEDMYEDRSSKEFFIIYQVTKDEYDTCMLYTGKRKNLVVNCSTPRQRKRFTIIFERYASIPHGQEYKSGEAYYFITTSTGHMQGLDNIHQGACHHNNMKLTIRVCCQETTTTTLPTTTTALSSTTTRRTTPSTRTRWKYPTTDKFPSTKHDGGKKEENDNDYNHENEVLPNKEQLVNRATSLVRGSASLLILCTCALLAHLVALSLGHR